MAKAWTRTPHANGLSYTIANPTRAAKYTKSPIHQSNYHKGNWRTVDDDLRRYTPEAYKRAYRAVEPTL
jgi:hypothetical protein